MNTGMQHWVGSALKLRTTTQRAVNESGFTLVEVLVALVILAIGLLGLAGLQVLGLKNIGYSGSHAQGTIMVHEFAERIHLNISDSAIDEYKGFSASSCASPSSTAEKDYCAVYNRIKNELRAPTDGTELLSFADGPVSNVYTITLTWVEKDVGGTDRNRSYSLNVVP